jgi:hypothetical protein
MTSHTKMGKIKSSKIRFIINKNNNFDYFSMQGNYFLYKSFIYMLNIIITKLINYFSKCFSEVLLFFVLLNFSFIIYFSKSDESIDYEKIYNKSQYNIMRNK